MMQVEINSPQMIGVLRATPSSSLFHQLIRQPTRQQDAKNAARKGTVVIKPAFSAVMPFLG